MESGGETALDMGDASLQHQVPSGVRESIVSTWKKIIAVGALHAGLSLAAVSLGAQGSLQLSGTIFDQNRAPVGNAEVTFRTAHVSQKSRSDDFGRFQFAGLTAGPAKLTVHRLGFREFTLPVEVGSADAEKPLTIDLMPLATDIDPVLIEDSRGRLQEFVAHRKQSKFGHFFDQNEIRAKAPRYLSDLFRSVPGATLSPASGSGSSLKLRGCQPRIWLDGVLAEGADIDELIPPSEVAGIEIYSSWAGVPAQYMDRENRACGTVLIWSRQA